GPADIVGQETVQLGLERGVGLRRLVRRIQLVDQRHQGLGDEAAAVGAEAALGVGPGVGVGQGGVHRRTLARGSGGNQADLAASRKAAIRTGSLTPGALSTPEETSTAGAPVIRAASARL